MVKSLLLLQMIDLLRDCPGLDIGQLADRLGRSPRTVYRYLEALSNELHVPVFCDCGAYYIADNSAGRQLDLSPKEVLSVRLALTSGAVNKSGPFAEHTRSAWQKIESALTADTLSSMQSALQRHSIYVPVLSDDFDSPEIMQILANAVERNRRVSILYRSHHSGETKQLLIDPYALVFRRHNWYLIAFSKSHGRVIQLKVIRVMRAEQTGETFQLPQDFSIDGFYAKGWEIWTGGEEYNVRVKFSPRVAQIIRESKRHATQKLQDTSDGGVIFSVRVAGIEEIGFWILGYGADAEVLEPLELRLYVENTARRMLEVYSTGSLAGDGARAGNGSGVDLA